MASERRRGSGRAAALAAVWAAVWAASAAQAQLRVVEWNITNYSYPSARDASFRTAFYGVAPNGLQLAPDVVVIQELEQGGSGNTSGHQGTGQFNAAGFASVLNSAPGSPGDYAAVTYAANNGDDGNALIYRTSKVEWIATTALTTNQGTGPNQTPRDTQRWQMRLVGYTGAGAELYIYGAHFKAGGNPEDSDRRIPESRRIRIDANALPAGANFLIAADFNLQNSGQTEYQYLVALDPTPVMGEEFLATASGRFHDPINTPASGSMATIFWENNGTYRNIHTQDPASAMDSRHDQILFSATLRDGQGIDYLPRAAGGNVLSPFSTYINAGMPGTWDDPNHTYRCWGNDGSSFNNPLNSTAGNSMVGAAIGQALVTCAAGGGHLPVYLDLQVPARASAPMVVDFGTVNQNSTATAGVAVWNGGNVALWSRNGTSRGIDDLDYTLAASGGFAAPAGAFQDAAGGATNVHTLSMNTGTLGPKNGTLTIASNDPGTPALVVTLTGTVVGGYDFDVNNDGLVNNEDLHRWYGLFTDVDGSGMVDASDVGALRTQLRVGEVGDMTAGLR
ncbi:MAG: hypothetical protein IT438_06355 [Phycisphaerales bacterium]|nr:hypothetical protein [Phycisphaerales bacterium]